MNFRQFHKILRFYTKPACEKQLDCARCKENFCIDGVKPKEKVKKKGLFGGLFGGSGKEEQTKVRPPKEECKIEQAKKECQPDPDLRQFGGEPYKTCGCAYVIQKHRAGTSVDPPQTKETKILKQLEAEPDLKDKQDDPMPPFTSVEQRMMDLDERKLHPLYRKYRSQTQTKKVTKNKMKKPPEYKTISGPIQPDDYPINLKFNKELLEKKNLYAEYKKVQPPQQMVAKILEIKRNEKPTLERKFPHLDAELQKAKARRNVFDTLHQTDSITDKLLEKEKEIKTD